MAPAVCVHTSRFAQAPGRDGKGVGIFSFAGKGGGRSGSGGSGGCPGLAPPTLPGAGRRGKRGGGDGGPGCPAVPSSGMLAVLPEWEKSLWSRGHQRNPLQHPSKTLISHIPAQRQNNPTYFGNFYPAAPSIRGEGTPGQVPSGRTRRGTAGPALPIPR